MRLLWLASLWVCLPPRARLMRLPLLRLRLIACFCCAWRLLHLRPLAGSGCDWCAGPDAAFYCLLLRFPNFRRLLLPSVALVLPSVAFRCLPSSAAFSCLSLISLAFCCLLFVAFFSSIASLPHFSWSSAFSRSRKQQSNTTETNEEIRNQIATIGWIIIKHAKRHKRRKTSTKSSGQLIKSEEQPRRSDTGRKATT